MLVYPFKILKHIIKSAFKRFNSSIPRKVRTNVTCMLSSSCKVIS